MNPERLRFVTKSFYSLQGLRMVLFGMFLLGWKLVEPVWPKSNLRDSYKLVLTAATIAGWIVLGRYYGNRFGRVRHDVALSGVAWAALCFIAWVYASHLDVKGPPVSFASIFFACFFATVAIASRGRRWYYLVAAAAFMVFSVVPMMGVLSARAVDGMPLAVTLGLAFVFTGVLDHRLLVRSLPVPADA